MKIKKAFKHPDRVAEYLLKRWGGFIPDKTYLKMLYRVKMGKSLDLTDPKTFNEKLQWLKLHDRKPEYTQLVDKDQVKEYIRKTIGEEYVIPTIGRWDSVEEIEWDKLPDRFVLKTTHGGGGTGVVVCKDKSKFNLEEAIKRLNLSMKSDIYQNCREWPYKSVAKKIIAEEYIEDSKGELTDYKFFCFDGFVDCVMLCLDRQTGDTKFYFFDKDWNFLRLNKRGIAAKEGFTLPKPEGMDRMFEIASKLSKGRPFSRIDLYNVDGRIYFGEITFYPDAGFDRNLLPVTDERWQKLLDLNKLSR